MERYEFSEGSSNKYWEVAVEGETLTVRYGKIGTVGQTKAKAFASAEAAEKEKAKLVKEKTGKGYVAVGSSAPPVALASIAVATSPKQKAAALSAATATSIANSTATPSIEATPAAPAASAPSVRERAVAGLPTRLRPTASMSADVAWSRFSARLKAASKRKHEHWYVQWPSDLGESNPGKPSMAVATKISRRLIHAAHEVVITGSWSDPLYLRGREAVEVFTYFSHWIVANCGGAFAMEFAETQRKQMLKEMDWWRDAWMSPAALGMRSAITSAPEEQYEEALAWSLAHAKTSTEFASDVTLAFILADDRPTQHALKLATILTEAAAQKCDMHDSLYLPLIAEVPTEEGKAWRTKDCIYAAATQFVAPTMIAATILATARVAGQAPQPVLKWMHSIIRDHHSENSKLAWLSGVLEARDESSLVALLPHLHEAQVRKAFDTATKDDPAWVFQACLSVLADGHSERVLRSRILKIAEDHGAKTARAWAAAASERAAAQFEKLTVADATGTAATDQLPAFLASPPWHAKKTAQAADIALEIAPIETPSVYHGKASGDDWYKSQAIGTLDKFYETMGWFQQHDPDQMPKEAMPKASDGEQAVAAWIMRHLDRLAASKKYSYFDTYPTISMHGHFDAFALAMWEKVSPNLKALASYTWRECLPTMLFRFGAKVIPGAVRIVAQDPLKLFPVLEHIDAACVAPLVARALPLKRLRGPAFEWLRAYPRTAAFALLPVAVGPFGTDRNEAEFAIRWLKSNKPDALDAAIAEYSQGDPRFAAAIAQVLGRDPFARTPKKVPPRPIWLAIGALKRPELKVGGALPDAAIVALLEMCSFINPDDVYAGVPAMKEACTSPSLAGFAWSLFEAWLGAGAPAKDGWAFRALGWFGDDECARQLTRMVRKWPGEAAHARAVTGLDVLADIGSDVALLNLNGIAEKLKFKGLQDRARDKIAAIADARDLSPEELADRLVPDLDLDERGGLDLDFGPRQFRVGFDEFLKPWVKDTTGKRLKDLPKPVKTDGAAKAAAASAKWSALKKDARAVASLQLTRLETMLATGRRAKPATFQTFFAAHPLVRHLAQRLVWGVYDTDHPEVAPKTMFRVTEDLAFTDASDEPVAINVSESTDGHIGLVHPLHMREADKTAWGGLFGDYEIAQPFAQLGRETYALTEAEKALHTLDRFKGMKVESKRVRGLTSHGWRTGQPQDGGGIMWIERMVTMGGERVPAALHLPDGLYVGAASEEPQFQELGGITFSENYYGTNPHRVGDLDAVTASEILRAVKLLIEASTP